MKQIKCSHLARKHPRQIGLINPLCIFVVSAQRQERTTNSATRTDKTTRWHINWRNSDHTTRAERTLTGCPRLRANSTACYAMKLNPGSSSCEDLCTPKQQNKPRAVNTLSHLQETWQHSFRRTSLRSEEPDGSMHQPDLRPHT